MRDVPFSLSADRASISSEGDISDHDWTNVQFNLKTVITTLYSKTGVNTET